MADVPFKHLTIDKVREFLRAPAMTWLSRDAKDELRALALFGKSDDPFDYSRFLDYVAAGGFREFALSTTDVRRGVQKLGIADDVESTNG